MLTLHKRTRGHGKGQEGAKEEPSLHANGLYAWGFDYEAALGIGAEHFGEGFNFPQGVVDLTKVTGMACGERSIIFVKDDGTIWSCGTRRGGTQGQGESTQEADEVSQPKPTRVVGGTVLYPAETYGPDKKGKTFLLPRGPIGPIVPKCVAVASGNLTPYALTEDGRVLAWGSNSFGQVPNGWEPEKGEDPKVKLESGKYRPQSSPWWVQTAGPAQSETGRHPGGMLLTSGVVGEPSQVYSYDTAWGAGTASNILKDVKAIAAAHLVAYFLKTNGQVFYAGLPIHAGGERAYLAAPETVWNAYATAHGITNVSAICCGRGGYALLLGDGTVRVVSLGTEGVWGNGEEGGSISTFVVKTPELKAGEPLKNILAIAQGEYHMKALDSTGRLWTWGSNGNIQESTGNFIEEGQQGLGPREAIVLRPTQITTLGTNVAAVAGGGMERGTGTFGGDTCIALMKDGTIRTWGKNYDPDAPGGAVHGQGVGALGDDTFNTSGTPKTPRFNGTPLSSVTLVEAGQAHMVVAQEPGSPAQPTVKARSPKSKELIVEWRNVSGTVGTLPLWRDAEGYSLKVTRMGDNPATGKREKSYSANKLPAVTKSDPSLPTNNHIFLLNPPEAGYTEAPDEWEIGITEELTTEILVPTGGSIKTASGGSLAMAWSNPIKAEPGWYVEWQRTQQYQTGKKTTLSGAGKAADQALAVATTKGMTAGHWLWVGEEQVVVLKVDSATVVQITAPLAVTHPAGTTVILGELENFHRSDMLPGSARNYTIALEPSIHGLTGEQLTVIVEGAFIGAFRKRVFFANVLP